MTPRIPSRLFLWFQALFPKHTLLSFMSSPLRVFSACRPHMVTEYMGIRNESFMKIAAVGTWMGDFVTAWMVSLFTL